MELHEYRVVDRPYVDNDSYKYSRRAVVEVPKPVAKYYNLKSVRAEGKYDDVELSDPVEVKVTARPWVDRDGSKYYRRSSAMAPPELADYFNLRIVADDTSDSEDDKEVEGMVYLDKDEDDEDAAEEPTTEDEGDEANEEEETADDETENDDMSEEEDIPDWVAVTGSGGYCTYCLGNYKNEDKANEPCGTHS